MYNFFLEYLKSNTPEDVISARGLKWRRLLSPALRKISPLTGHYKFVIESKAEIPKGTPVLYAPTHGFKDDLLYTIVLIGRHAYILFGSLPQFYNTFDGVTSWLNGVILVERTDKESRAASKRKMERAIKLGASVLLFPEGVWNKTESLLIQKLFPGIYDVAKTTGASVAPVATHLEGDTCYAILGDAFDITAYGRDEGLAVLRDKMATMKWTLIEKYSRANRADFDNGKSLPDQWKEVIDSRIAQVKYYDVEVENSAHYKDKNEVSEKEAFAHLDAVIPCRNNAFLFNKRLI